MATTQIPGASTVTDHAIEAVALLNAYVGRPENLTSAEQIAIAQVHATIAQARAAEANTDAVESAAAETLALLDDVYRAIVAAERPDPSVRSIEHLGYTVVAGRLLPGLWAVDVYCTEDPDRGEGPASFWSWGWPGRAIRRGVQWADQLADKDA